jgi:hypothetical protein
MKRINHILEADDHQGQADRTLIPQVRPSDPLVSAVTNRGAVLWWRPGVSPLRHAFTLIELLVVIVFPAITTTGPGMSRLPMVTAKPTGGWIRSPGHR